MLSVKWLLHFCEYTPSFYTHINHGPNYCFCPLRVHHRIAKNETKMKRRLVSFDSMALNRFLFMAFQLECTLLHGTQNTPGFGFSRICMFNWNWNSQCNSKCIFMHPHKPNDMMYLLRTQNIFDFDLWTPINRVFMWKSANIKYKSFIIFEWMAFLASPSQLI